jgi:hypothetical protein
MPFTMLRDAALMQVGYAAGDPCYRSTNTPSTRMKSAGWSRIGLSRVNNRKIVADLDRRLIAPGRESGRNLLPEKSNAA